MVGDILQPTHLLFVLVVALLVLGPKRLPEVGRTLGNGIRDFRSAINGESAESRESIASQPWHSETDPEEKHEFAHTGEATPESHEFAHQQSAATVAPATEPSATPQSDVASGTPPEPAGARSPATAPTDAELVEGPAQPATTSDTAGAAKHEFAYESSEAAEKSAGPRT